MCEVSERRIPEIKKLFMDSLGTGPYCSICYHNPAFKVLENQEKGSYQVPGELKKIYQNRLKRCYRPGNSKTSYHLKTVLIEFSDEYIPAIKQTIEPRIAKEFTVMEEYQNYYLSFSVISNKLKGGD